MTSNNNNKIYRKKGNVIYCILSGNSFCYPVHINTCQGIAESLQVMTIPIEQKNVDRSNAQMTTGQLPPIPCSAQHLPAAEEAI